MLDQPAILLSRIFHPHEPSFVLSAYALAVFAAYVSLGLAVLCDIQMAPMGGLEFVRQLRGSTHQRLSELRVIMLTRNADKETVLASRRPNIGDFMMKPISPKQLSIRLTTVFSNWDKSSSWNVADD